MSGRGCMQPDASTDRERPMPEQKRHCRHLVQKGWRPLFVVNAVKTASDSDMALSWISAAVAEGLRYRLAPPLEARALRTVQASRLGRGGSAKPATEPGLQ